MNQQGTQFVETIVMKYAKNSDIDKHATKRRIMSKLTKRFLTAKQKEVKEWKTKVRVKRFISASSQIRTFTSISQ